MCRVLLQCICFLLLFVPFTAFSETSEENKLTPQQLFEESLELLNPLSDEQIKEYRDFSQKQEIATAPAIPELKTRTVRISLEPGNPPLKVYTTANSVTALVFHDSTGSPWEITSLTNGSPTLFQILKPEIQEGNLINVLPLQSNAVSNLVITLKNKDIPLVISLESDNIKASSRSGDALVLVQLAHFGPMASIPIVEKLENTVSSEMIAFLDQVPPKEAKKMKLSLEVPHLTVYKYAEKIYVRTPDLLLFPSWIASVQGASQIKCYEVPQTKRLLLSVEGKLQTINLE